MNDLIEKLEAIEGPDRAVDAEIEAAQGFIPVGSRPCKGGWIIDGRAKESPRCTASIDAAMTLVPEGHLWTLDSFEGPQWTAGIWKPQIGWVIYPHEHKKTPAIALCIAALRAKEASHAD